jgi:hypothetical protein
MMIILAGCMSGASDNSQPQTLLYVCSSGETVSDPILCPRETSSTTTLPSTTTSISTTTTVPSTTTSTTTTTTTTTTVPEPQPILQLYNLVEIRSVHNKFAIEGRIQNQGEEELFFVQARLTIFDEHDNVLDIINSNPIVFLKPGETKRFNRIESDIIMSKVAGYKITLHHRDE